MASLQPVQNSTMDLVEDSILQTTLITASENAFLKASYQVCHNDTWVHYSLHKNSIHVAMALWLVHNE